MLNGLAGVFDTSSRIDVMDMEMDLASQGRELIRAHRVASEALQPEDISWLQRGFQAFLTSGGKLPLERCLRLPSNERSLRRACRDHWLRQAWLQIDNTLSAWRRSERLSVEVHRFQTSKWTRWSVLDEAPADASAIDEALFNAFRSHERVPATAMQIHNIAGQRRECALGAAD